MRKSALRAVIAGAGALTIFSGIGSTETLGTETLGQARADIPRCVADAPDPCPLQAQAPDADAPPAPHVQIYCHSAGPKWGAHCYRRIVP